MDKLQLQKNIMEYVLDDSHESENKILSCFREHDTCFNYEFINTGVLVVMSVCILQPEIINDKVVAHAESEYYLINKDFVFDVFYRNNILFDNASGEALSDYMDYANSRKQFDEMVVVLKNENHQPEYLKF